jgi:hypothetical protein
MKKNLLKAIMFTLITILLISIGLSFAEDKKVKSSNSIKLEEDIQLPPGEKWYEEGDEILYKFDIHPVTPNKGVNGGILIYYGHFVKPPYNIKRIGSEVFVNGLRIYPGDKYFENHLAEIKESRLRKKYPDNPERKKIREARCKIVNDARNLYSKLKTKYSNKKDASDLIKKDLNEFLSSYWLIEKYEIYNKGIIGFDYIVKGDKNKQLHYIELEEEIAAYTKKEIQVLDTNFAEEEKVSWNYTLSRFLYFYFYSSYPYSTREINLLEKVVIILKSRSSRIEKIQKLYLLLDNIEIAKVTFYNFDIIEYENWMNKYEKNN